MHIYIYIYMHVYIYICMRIYIYIPSCHVLGILLRTTPLFQWFGWKKNLQKPLALPRILSGVPMAFPSVTPSARPGPAGPDGTGVCDGRLLAFCTTPKPCATPMQSPGGMSIWYRSRSLGICQNRKPGYLVGGWFFATPLKNDGVSSSVGMMKFPIYGKIKCMFQSTTSYIMILYIYYNIYIICICMFRL